MTILSDKVETLSSVHDNDVQRNVGTINDYKQLLDEVFVISGIIKVEVSVISRSRR